jgi:hypothetical protein
MILSFGKYRGQDTSQVPASYLRWLEETQSRDLDQLRDAMEARGLTTNRPRPRERVIYQNIPIPPPAPPPLVKEMVRTGYKTLAKRYHPDLGGNTQQMQELNQAFEAWQDLTEETSSCR